MKTKLHFLAQKEKMDWETYLKVLEGTLKPRVEASKAGLIKPGAEFQGYRERRYCREWAGHQHHRVHTRTLHLGPLVSPLGWVRPAPG